MSQNCTHSFLGNICKVAIFIITVDIWIKLSMIQILKMWKKLCFQVLFAHIIQRGWELHFPFQIIKNNTSMVVYLYLMRTIMQKIKPSILFLKCSICKTISKTADLWEAVRAIKITSAHWIFTYTLFAVST